MQWMVAATLTSSLFVWTSCSNDDNAVIPQPGHETEFGALLKSLDWGTDTCFVYGHKTPDVDAISPDSVARLNRGMEDAATDYTSMTDAEIFLSDYKEYEIGGHLLGFGSLVCKQSQMEAFIDRMLAVMPEVMGQRGRQMLVAKIDNMVENTGDDRAERPYVENGTYFIYYGEGAKQVAETVFGPSLREGVCYTSEELSRKQIVPRITEVLTGN